MTLTEYKKDLRRSIRWQKAAIKELGQAESGIDRRSGHYSTSSNYEMLSAHYITLDVLEKQWEAVKTIKKLK